MTEKQLEKGTVALKEIKTLKEHISELNRLKKNWLNGDWVKIETANGSGVYVSPKRFGSFLDILIADAEEKLKIEEHNFKWI